ncbi:MAG: formylmethanofuran dehydrogenase subunit E family protein [Thermodesulfobacteriota bacterium]|nr:MAG: formylmethanofuran dehydrogenase subunit E family protein [Thermodesulfobacteriota bacterium]
MEEIKSLYKKAGEFHGSVCAGIILGVRMACLACRMHGINDPNSPENRKQLMTWVEIDRCATDGIQSVTGCSPGRRTLKVMNYGIMAATFLNLFSQKAFRISVHPDSRNKAKALFPELTDSNHIYIEAYKQMTDDDLFVVEEVRVEVPEREMPGPPPKRTACSICREEIHMGCEIIKEDKTLCRRCADMPLYYTPLK